MSDCMGKTELAKQQSSVQFPEVSSHERGEKVCQAAAGDSTARHSMSVILQQLLRSGEVRNVKSGRRRRKIEKVMQNDAF
jgi:hypothetical protein